MVMYTGEFDCEVVSAVCKLLFRVETWTELFVVPFGACPVVDEALLGDNIMVPLEPPFVQLTFNGAELFIICTTPFDCWLVADKIPSGVVVTVLLRSTFVTVLHSGGTILLVTLNTIAFDGCMVEDISLSGNEMMVPLGLTLSIEVTEMVYEELSLFVQSIAPQPSTVLF